MELSAIISLIGNAGIMIVCSGLVIYFMKKIMDQSIEDRKSQVEIQNKMFETLINNNKSTDVNKHPNLEVRTEISQLDNQIHDILVKIKDTSKADRVSYFSFHNGGESISGIPYLRMTCKDEVIRSGVGSMLYEAQMLQLGPYSTLLSQLRKYGKYIINDYLELKSGPKEDGYMYDRVHNKRNASSVYFFALMNDNTREVIGFISCDYIASLKDRQVNEADLLELLDNESSHISTLLTLKSKYNY